MRECIYLNDSCFSLLEVLKLPWFFVIIIIVVIFHLFSSEKYKIRFIDIESINENSHGIVSMVLDELISVEMREQER